jgi:O-antigen/teichoic acid export membrane protein
VQIVSVLGDDFGPSLQVAVLALAGVVPGRLGAAIRSSRVLAILAGAMTLLHVSQAALALDENKYHLALWMLIWAVPVAVWLGGARGGRERLDHTRIAVMVFYLPIFLLGIAFMVVLTYLSPGLGSFVVGMLLVWWGLTQSQWQVAGQPDPHAP